MDITLESIVSLLSIEDVSLLNSLVKNEAISNSISIPKSKILKDNDKLTDYKFQISAARLEIVKFIGKNSSKLYNKYYITETGLNALKLYKSITKEKIEDLKD